MPIVLTFIIWVAHSAGRVVAACGDSLSLVLKLPAAEETAVADPVASVSWPSSPTACFGTGCGYWVICAGCCEVFALRLLGLWGLATQIRAGCHTAMG